MSLGNEVADKRNIIGLRVDYDPFRNKSVLDFKIWHALYYLMTAIFFVGLGFSPVISKIIADGAINSQNKIQVIFSFIDLAIIAYGLYFLSRAIPEFLSGSLKCFLKLSGEDIFINLDRGPIGREYIDFKFYFDSINFQHDGLVVVENLSKKELGGHIFSKKPGAFSVGVDRNIIHKMKNDDFMLKITILYTHQFTGIRKRIERFLDGEALAKAAAQCEQPIK